MLLTSFQSGPLTKEVDHEHFNYMKIRNDLEQQYLQLKGKSHQMYRMKKALICEFQEVVTLQEQQSELQQDINQSLLKKRETFKDLHHLVSILYEKVYEAENIDDLDILIPTYSKARLDFFENLKKNAIIGVLRGSKNFIETLIQA